MHFQQPPSCCYAAVDTLLPNLKSCRCFQFGKSLAINEIKRRLDAERGHANLKSRRALSQQLYDFQTFIYDFFFNFLCTQQQLLLRHTGACFLPAQVELGRREKQIGHSSQKNFYKPFLVVLLMIGLISHYCITLSNYSADGKTFGFGIIIS